MAEAKREYNDPVILQGLSKTQWFIFALKIGIVAALFLGGGVYLLFFQYLFPFRIIGLCGCAVGVFLIIGAFGRFAGLTLRALRNIKVNLITDQIDPKKK